MPIYLSQSVGKQSESSEQRKLQLIRDKEAIRKEIKDEITNMLENKDIGEYVSGAATTESTGKNEGSSDTTRVDQWIVSAKNHPFLSLLILGTLILAGMASITDSVSKIANIFTKQVPAEQSVIQSSNTLPVHRLFHPKKQSFLFTTNTGEKEAAEKLGWQYQGVGFQAPVPNNSTVPVYLSLIHI